MRDQDRPKLGFAPSSPPRRAVPALGHLFRVFWSLVVVVVACLIYFNSLKNPYLIDDIPIILQHPDVQLPSGVTQLWFHDYWYGSAEDKNLYRPLTILSFNLNGQLLGFEPPMFRVGNVALLAMIAIIGSRWAARYIRREAAWLSAFFFVCHPANIESINTVVGRADLQSLLGIVSFLYVQRGMLDRGKWSFTGGLIAVCSALLAVGSKESGMVLVPAAIMQAWSCGWLAREGVTVTNSVHAMFDVEDDAEPVVISSGLVVADPEQEAIEVDIDDATNEVVQATPMPPLRPLPRPKPVPMPLTPGWRPGSFFGGGHFVGIFIALAAAGVYLAARFAVVGKSIDFSHVTDDLTGNPVRNMGFLERLPAAFEVAWIYTRQIFWPDLSFVLTPETLGGWLSFQTLAGAVVAAIAVLSFVAFARWRQWIAIILTLMIGHYLIVGQLLFPIGVLASNRLVLPFTLGASFLLGVVVHKAIIKAMIGRAMGLSFIRRETEFARWVNRHPWIAPACFTLMLVAMSGTVVRGNMQWRSEVVRALSDSGVREGNAICLYNAGTALANIAGDSYSPTILSRAEAYLLTAVGRRPDSAQARLQLAGVYWREHKLEHAEAEYREALKIQPDNASAGLKLGVLLMVQENYPAAEAQLLEADTLKPRDPEIMYNLAEVAKARGKYTDAVRRYQALLNLYPEHEKGKAQYKELTEYLKQQGPR